MIKFNEVMGQVEILNTNDSSGYKEIKPILGNSFESIKEFWNDLFGIQQLEKIVLTEEEYIDGVFNRDESEFSFDLDVKDSAVKKVLDCFDENEWRLLTEDEKFQVMDEFCHVLSEKLDIKRQPWLKLFEDEWCYHGEYVPGVNMVKINRNILNEPGEVIGTIAHEVRHAYQYQRACIGETKEDALYAYNFTHYLEPQKFNGKYINFIDYQNQLVEAEARAFAGLFQK